MRGIRRGRRALAESTARQERRREQLSERIGARDAAILETKMELSPTIILDTAVGDTIRILEQLLPEGAEVSTEMRSQVIDLMKRQLLEAGRVAENQMDLHAEVLEGSNTVAYLKQVLEFNEKNPADFALCALSPAYFHETMHPLPETSEDALWPGQVFHVAISRGPLGKDGTPRDYLSPNGVSFQDQIAAAGIDKSTPIIIADENLGSGGTILRVRKELEEAGYTVVAAAVGFYSKIKGTLLAGSLPVIANVSRYETARESAICKEYGLDIHPSTEIGDSTLSEGIRASDGKKRTILAGTFCIDSSFFRRLERIGAYNEYLLDALENEKIKFIGLKEIASVDTIPISTTLLVNDGYLMREIGNRGWDAQTDVITVIDYLIEKQKHTIERERAETMSERRQYYEAVVKREGQYFAALSYDDIDGSSVPEIATDSEGYVQLRKEGDRIIGLQPILETVKFSTEKENAGLVPEQNYVHWLTEHEIGLSKTSTRSIEECLYIMDQTNQHPDFLGAEDGNVCWLRKRPSESTLIALRKKGYIIQDLGPDGVVIHTRTIEFKSAANAEMYPYSLDTIVERLRQQFPTGFIESNEAVAAYSAGDSTQLAEANRILQHPAGDLEYTRRALTRYASRLLLTENENIKQAYQELARSFGLHTADYGAHNPVIATANNDKALPLEVYALILQEEYGLHGLVVESRLNSSNDVQFALKAATGAMEGVQARIHFMAAGKVRPEEVNAVKEALGERVTVLEKDGEHYIFKITAQEYQQLVAAGVDLVYGTPSDQAFGEIEKQIEQDVVVDIERPSIERLHKGVMRAGVNELMIGLERLYHYEGIDAVEGLLNEQQRAAVQELERMIAENGESGKPYIFLDSDGTVPLVINPKRPTSYRGPFMPGGAIAGEPPRDYVRDLQISPDQVELWSRLADHGVSTAILSGRSSSDLLATYEAALEEVADFAVFPAKGRGMLIKEGLHLSPDLEQRLESDPLIAVADVMARRMVDLAVAKNVQFAEIRKAELLALWERAKAGDKPANEAFESGTGYRVSRQRIGDKTVLIRLHHLYKACQIAADHAIILPGITDPKKVRRDDLAQWLHSEDGAATRTQLESEIQYITSGLIGAVEMAPGESIELLLSDEVGGRSFCQDIAPRMDLSEFMVNFHTIMYAGDNPEVGGDDAEAMQAVHTANPRAVVMAVHHGVEHNRDETVTHTLQGTQFELQIMQYALLKRLESKST